MTITATPTTTLTAKHFQEPLLRALGALSGLTAGVTVSGEDTYAPVMAIMGIPDINHLGIEAGSGQPLVQRNIQWACKNLRKLGHVDLLGRGQWTLTPAGVTVLQNLGGAFQVSPVVTPPVSAPPASPQRAPVLSRGHLDDAYILSLILSQTGCLGNYTPHQGAECATCSVVPECQSKQYAAFSQIAAKLSVRDKLAAMPPTTAPSQPPPSTGNKLTTAKATVAAQGVPPKVALDLTNATEISAHQEALCTECGLPITKGSKCWWIEDLTTETTILAHLTCLGAK